MTTQHGAHEALGNTPKVEEVVKDPTQQFSSPREVVEDTTLSMAEKRRILESWVKDSELLAEADTENMSGGEGARLRESKLALADLNASEGSGTKS